MSKTDESWNLIEHVLASGPPDGDIVLEYAHAKTPLEALYLATRNSKYAESWRVEFGRVREDREVPSCILDLAILCVEQFCYANPRLHEAMRQEVDYALRLIANCCADNNANRKMVIRRGGLQVLLKLLDTTFKADVLIPTLYNVCADYDEPANNWLSSPLSQSMDADPVNLAEEYLATYGHTNSIFAGVYALLNPELISKCSLDIHANLAELIEMASRPIAITQAIEAGPGEVSAVDALGRLLAPDGGALLIKTSLSCRIHICRALLAVSNFHAARVALASSGDVVWVALTAHPNTDDPDYLGEHPEDREENARALGAVQTASLKLLYEVCQRRQFLHPPKYGIARHALECLLQNPDRTPNYLKAVALITLYGFVDNDARAILLASEGLIPPLVALLGVGNDRSVIYPAVALAAKLAVTWRLRSLLVEAGVIQTGQHLLVGSDLGFEIPPNMVILLELLVKGHKQNANLLYKRNFGLESSATVMEDLMKLFDRGHEAINIEIGRLLIEMCSTMAQKDASDTDDSSLSFETFLEHIDVEAWSKVLTFIATKAPAADRVWLALGLLSTIPRGRMIVDKVLSDPDVQMKLHGLSKSQGTPVFDNIKFMLYNMKSSDRPSLSGEELNDAMTRMRLQ